MLILIREDLVRSYAPLLSYYPATLTLGWMEWQLMTHYNKNVQLCSEFSIELGWIQLELLHIFYIIRDQFLWLMVIYLEKANNIVSGVTRLSNWELSLLESNECCGVQYLFTKKYSIETSMNKPVQICYILTVQCRLAMLTWHAPKMQLQLPRQLFSPTIIRIICISQGTVSCVISEE